MGVIGRIIGRSTAKNKDSGTDVILLEVELTEPGDDQQVENFRLAGIDSNPPTGSHVLVDEAGGFLLISSVHDEIEQESAEGEIEIYSSDDGAKQARVKCESGGDVVINQGSLPAARQNHQIRIDATTAPDLFTWLNAVSSALFGGPVPFTQIVGVISEGSATVKIP